MSKRWERGCWCRWEHSETCHNREYNSLAVSLAEDEPQRCVPCDEPLTDEARCANCGRHT